jgi:GntR family transcriptional regulator
MWLPIDPRSSKPVYQQVVEGVKEAVAKGLLAPGDRMPSVRELAAQLTLNHNTVAKAYQELERERVIEVERGRGTFIAASSPRPDREERVRALAEKVREMLVEAHHLQMCEEELLELFHATVRAWQEERRRLTRDGGRADGRC